LKLLTVPYAHTLANRPEADWEPLSDHLRKVAELAAGFAAVFDSGEWGRLAGLWHDLGKYQAKFQERLRGSGESVEHAGAGAALAISKDPVRGLALAFAIAGHHAGLANLTTEEPGRLPLRVRLKENQKVLSSLLPLLPAEMTAPGLPALPERIANRSGQKPPARFRRVDAVSLLVPCGRGLSGHRELLLTGGPRGRRHRV
jgi:CRISPR-associated endonuclease/helicase Cas3